MLNCISRSHFSSEIQFPYGLLVKYNAYVILNMAGRCYIHTGMEQSVQNSEGTQSWGKQSI